MSASTSITTQTPSYVEQYLGLSFSKIEDISKLQTFEETATALFDELARLQTNNTRHNNMALLKEILEIPINPSKPHLKQMFPTELFYIIKNEEKLDRLQEIFYCPIDFELLKEPVLLDSGHTISQYSLENLNPKRNPFHRGPLVFMPDRATLLLLRCLKLYACEQHVSDSPECLSACKEMEEQPFFIKEHIIWMRLLGAIMPSSHYFVRKKNENHYVLVARLPVFDIDMNSPLSKFAKEHSVVQISFCFNKNGKISLISTGDKTIFNDLTKLCKKVKLKGFSPLSTQQLNELENYVGKKAFLESCINYPQESNLKYNEIIRHLEGRYSPEIIKQNAAKYQTIFRNGIFFRASINPTSFPCITCMKFGDNVSRNSTSKLTFSDGKLVDALCIEIIKGKFNTSKTSNIKLNELNVSDEIKNRIKDEFSKLADVNQKIDIFVDNIRIEIINNTASITTLKSLDELDESIELEKSIKEEYLKLITNHPNIKMIFIPTPEKSCSLNEKQKIVNLNDIPDFLRVVNNAYYCHLKP